MLMSMPKISIKKTVLSVRAYCSDFEYEYIGKTYLNLEEAQSYLVEDGMTTAMVKSVTQYHRNNTRLSIYNDKYKDPTEMNFKNLVKPRI